MLFMTEFQALSSKLFWGGIYRETIDILDTDAATV
jgi:hypothetical protein